MIKQFMLNGNSAITIVATCSSLCCRIDTAAASVVDESTPVGAHGKQKKDRVGSETSKTVAENTNSKTAKNTAGSSKKKKKQKQKHTETKLPTISDERLKAYGINPKKFKYFHQKKLLREQR